MKVKSSKIKCSVAAVVVSTLLAGAALASSFPPPPSSVLKAPVTIVNNTSQQVNLALKGRAGTVMQNNTDHVEPQQRVTVTDVGSSPFLNPSINGRITVSGQSLCTVSVDSQHVGVNQDGLKGKYSCSSQGSVVTLTSLS